MASTNPAIYRSTIGLPEYLDHLTAVARRPGSQISMPCATTLRWQFVANGIKFRDTGITPTAGPVHYLLWRQRRAESLPALRLSHGVPTT
jgi:hypothetical protein